VFDFEAQEATVLAVHASCETKIASGTRLPLELFEDIEELRQDQVHMVEDLQSLSPSPPLIQALQAEGLGAYINVPLVAEGELIGSLTFGAGRPRAFTIEHLDFARAVADQLAAAIQHARSYELLQRYVTDLERRVAERHSSL
jgi:GAF domain-containing protein